MKMEKINLVELLKDCPEGMELDCTICNGVTFIELDRNPNYPIVVVANNGYVFSLTKYGQVHNIDDAKCVIFPKGKTTWEEIKAPFRDGDVVSTDDGMFTAIVGKVVECEIKDLYNHDEVYITYCHIYYEEDDDKDYFVADDTPLRFDRLANEEEKERLFKAIKENGCKWNSETNTLEKLIEPRFKVGDRIKWKGHDASGRIEKIEDDVYHVDYGYDDGIIRVNLNMQDDYDLVPNKFDISTLKPFDKVLVKYGNITDWEADLFSHYDEGMPNSPFCCISSWYERCIPYEGNEHLLGTNDDCDEYYKNWK